MTALTDGDPGPATAAIRRSLAAEAAAGAAILALVAWFGMLEPYGRDGSRLRRGNQAP